MSEQRWVLRLYIAGRTWAAERAIAALEQICEQRLQGRYSLEVVDLTEQPEAAERAQILAVPTLVRELPRPLRKLIGDLSDQDKLLAGLELEQAKS